MPGRIIELKNSGDFKAGPSGVDGKGVAVVIDAADQDEAFALAHAFFPPMIAGIPRGSIDVVDEGGDVYSINVEYRNAIAEANPPEAGQTPDTARPPGEGGGPGGNDEPLTRDMTFSTGGTTKRIYKSNLTVHRIAKAGDVAPNFRKLIGWNEKDKKLEGCEVIAPSSDFTITKRFSLITLGWFRNMLDLVGCTNETDWLGMAAGEVLFKGCDGNYKDGDAHPWTITGKFAFSRNRTLADSPLELNVGDLQIPDVRGWEHVWIAYAAAVDAGVIHGGAPMKVMVEYPRWAFVERVYSEGDFSKLGLDT